jgi:nickel-type superoxide dismutase maturation protease
MVPTLEPGDRLLVRRAGRLRRGDVVALHDPCDQTRIMIKRVHAVTADGLDVRGDNPSGSTDSRAFGLVAPDAVIGRAWYCYAPPGRTGRLASPGPAGS